MALLSNPLSAISKPYTLLFLLDLHKVKFKQRKSSFKQNSNSNFHLFHFPSRMSRTSTRSKVKLSTTEMEPATHRDLKYFGKQHAYRIIHVTYVLSGECGSTLYVGLAQTAPFVSTSFFSGPNFSITLLSNKGISCNIRLQLLIHILAILSHNLSSYTTVTRK